MITYYVCRDVVRGAICSYKPGRTLLNRDGIFSDPDKARAAADLWNGKCSVAGVNYLVIPHRDDVVFECDHYEN